MHTHFKKLVALSVITESWNIKVKQRKSVNKSLTGPDYKRWVGVSYNTNSKRAKVFPKPEVCKLWERPWGSAVSVTIVCAVSVVVVSVLCSNG